MTNLLTNLRSISHLPVPTKLAVAAVSLTVGLLGACCFRASIASQDAIAAAPHAAESLFLRRYSPAAHRVSPQLNPTDTVAVVPPPFVTAEVTKYATVYQPENSPVELQASLPPLPPLPTLPIPDWGDSSSSDNSDNIAALLPTEIPVKDSSVFSPPPVPPTPAPVPVVPAAQNGLVSIATLPMTTLPAQHVASRYPSAPSGLVPLDSLKAPRTNSASDTIVPIPHLSAYAE